MQQTPNAYRVQAPHIEGNEREPMPVAVRTGALTVEKRAKLFSGTNAVLCLHLSCVKGQIQISPEIS
jgi:hypothetical protein